LITRVILSAAPLFTFTALSAAAATIARLLLLSAFSAGS
jgi:hypothetical protein